MNIAKIKVSLKKFKEAFLGLTFLDEETSELLLNIAEYIVSQPSQGTHSIPSEFLTIAEFEEKYIFISANTLWKYCKNDDQFRNQCALSDGQRWYVHPDKTIEFLNRKPIFKKRLERNFFKEKISQ